MKFPFQIRNPKDKQSRGPDIVLTRAVHPQYLEYSQILKLNPKYPIAPNVGKYQYFVESHMGRISIVELPDHLADSITIWESHSVEGNLFDGNYHYRTLQHATAEAIRILIDAETESLGHSS